MHMLFKTFGPYAHSMGGGPRMIATAGRRPEKKTYNIVGWTYDIVGWTYDIVCKHTMSVFTTTWYVNLRYRMSDIRYRAYDMHLPCRMYTTYDIVCISEPTISYTIYFHCDLRCRMYQYVTRCRMTIYDIVKTYDVKPTMSQVLPLNMAHTIFRISYVRCDVQYSRCDLRGRIDRPTISQVTYDIVCGKNPDVVLYIGKVCLLERFVLQCQGIISRPGSPPAAAGPVPVIQSHFAIGLGENLKMLQWQMAATRILIDFKSSEDGTLKTHGLRCSSVQPIRVFSESTHRQM